MQPLTKLHAEFLEDLEIGQGRSGKTVANYDRYLRRFYSQQKVSTISGITEDAVRSFRRYLNTSAPRPHDISKTGVSLATQNYHLIALRQFLKYLAKRDIPALSSNKINLAKLDERDIDVLYPEEIDALLKATLVFRASDNPPPVIILDRDQAILETLFSTGVRVAEAISLDREDIRQASGELSVRGKGNRVRVVFLSDSAQTAIKNYLRAREDIDPALFVRHHAGPTQAGENAGADLRLTARTIQRLIKKYSAAAGITKNITPHTLRHSFATDLLANGADVREVQQLLGHASITTTQAYTHLTDVHLKDIHAKYHRKRA